MPIETFPLDGQRVANYRVREQNDDYVVLEDLGPWDTYQTITNAAEWVVRQVDNLLRGRRLYYIDSDGNIDQLLVHDGRFAGFISGGPQQ